MREVNPILRVSLPEAEGFTLTFELVPDRRGSMQETSRIVYLVRDNSVTSENSSRFCRKKIDRLNIFEK